MKRRLQMSLGLFGSICLLMQLPAQTRYHQYMKRMGSPPDLIEISTSSLFGGRGNEGFVSAGFREDGDVLVGGIAFGPEFDPGRGVSVKVLAGKDGPLPSLEMLERMDKGPVDTTQQPGEKKNQYRRRMAREKAARKVPPLVDMPDGAPFVVRFNQKMNKVEQVVRLPWGTGSMSDMTVTPKGEVYLTGRLDGTLTGAKELKNPYEFSAEKARMIYLMKLSSNLKSVEWVLKRKDEVSSPELQLLEDGKLLWIADVIQQFTPKGKLAFTYPDVSSRGYSRAVDPVSGKIALGGDHNKNTGREPWRRPYLNIYDERGEMETNLYSWDPAYVGMSGRRLVSDSSIRGATYSTDGQHLWLVGWSDGGNSVLNKQPFDLEREVTNNGMGMSAWGANVTSVCYIIKMNTQTYEVEVKSLWMAYLKQKNAPTGMSIDDMDIASSGELVAAGGGGGGVIMTRNHLYRGPENPEWAPGGTYVSIFRPELNGFRFSSVLPAAGKVNIMDRKKLRVVTGEIGNTQRAIAVGVAVKEAQSKYDLEPQAYPSTGNALQPEFGGGLIDGCLLLLEWPK